MPLNTLPTVWSAQSYAIANLMKNADPSTATLVLAGKVVPVMTLSVHRKIDDVAWGWTAEIAWTPGKDPDLDKRVAPFAYPMAQVYLGSTLVVTGYLYTVTAKATPDGITKELEGWSFTADLVDSSVPPVIWGNEWNNISLLALAQKLTANVGINVDYFPTANEASLAPFDIVQASNGETYSQLLTRLASERGILVSSNEKGNLIFAYAHTNAKPVASLTEGQAPGLSYQIKFNGRERWNTYGVYGQAGDASIVYGASTDPKVPASRVKIIIAPTTNSGNAIASATWKRNKQIADAMMLPFPVVDWYDPHGVLWTPNTIVAVTAPSLNIANGALYVIRGTEHILTAKGRTTTLDLVPSVCYTQQKAITENQLWQ